MVWVTSSSAWKQRARGAMQTSFVDGDCAGPDQICDRSPLWRSFVRDGGSAALQIRPRPQEAARQMAPAALGRVRGEEEALGLARRLRPHQLQLAGRHRLQLNLAHRLQRQRPDAAHPDAIANDEKAVVLQKNAAVPPE